MTIILLDQLRTEDGTSQLVGYLNHLFWGRSDIVAKRWEKKDGASGYSPICKNEWLEDTCNKTKAGGTCDSCLSKSYVTVSEYLLKKHINGDLVLGTYPIHPDGNVTFAAADFDDHQGNKEPLDDVLKYHSICKKYGFALYVLRSRSGVGYHAYIFFEHPLPAREARILILCLLEEAGIVGDNTNINSFDRIFPNQDRLSGKGLGNLIALPYQGHAIKKNHTLLLNPDTGFREPYENQLLALSNIKRIPVALVTEFINGHKPAENASKPIENMYMADDTTIPTSGANFNAIYEQCGFITHSVKDAKTLGEQEWYAMISIASRCQNGREMVHEVSKPYPHYNQSETDKKIDHAFKDTGPFTCNYIMSSINGSFCNACSSKGKIKSPIILGLPLKREWWHDITPLDVFGDVDVFGEPEWPEHACPVVIDEFARDEAARLGVCPSMIAMPALTVAAACIPDQFTIQPKEHDSEWTESARLWTLCVAPPGTKKTPAQSKAIKPVDSIEHELHLKNKKLLKKYDEELAAYETWKKSSKRIGYKERPEKPPLKRKMTNDTTTEALSDILKDNPEGILVRNDEMSRFIGSMDCYRGGKVGKDRSDWIELNNGGPRIIDRVKKGNIHVPNWSGCVLGSIQPGPAKREFASINDDGLIQRFDIFWGRLIDDGEDRRPKNEKIEVYHQLIKNLYLLGECNLPFPKNPYKLSSEAQEQRKNIKNTIRNVMALPSISDAFRYALEKWEGRFARFLLTFHIVEAVSRGEMPESHISGETAERAARLMIAFLLPNAARFYTDILPSNQYVKHARWAAGFILAKGSTELRERDLYRANREFRDSPDILHETMKILGAMGWVEPGKFRNNGRPIKWSINPQCHTMYAKRAELEKRRRQEVREKIREATIFLGVSSQGEDDESI